MSLNGSCLCGAVRYEVDRFCSLCGTHLFAGFPLQPHIILRVPTLDDDPGTTPARHIWTSHAAPGLIDGEDLPRYPEWHPDR